MTTHERTGPPKILLWTGSASSSQIDLSHDCVAFNVSTNLTQPAGTWTLTIVPRQSNDRQTPADIRRAANLYNSVRPNCVVSIGFQELGGICIGLVSTCQMTDQLSGPTPGKTLTITGATIGKVLVQDSIYRGTIDAQNFPAFQKKVESALGADTPILKDITGTLGPTSGNGDDATSTFVLASVKDVVDWILANTTSMLVPLFARTPYGGPFGSTGAPATFIKTDKSVTNWHDQRVNGDGPSSYQGTIFNFITSILDRDFYESWVDSVPNGTSLPDIHLIIRPKPFDEPDFDIAPVDRSQESQAESWSWDSLTTMVDGLTNHEIDISEVLNLQRGFGDTDATSWYVVTGRYDIIGGGDAQTDGCFHPLIDTYVAKNFGLRNYSTSVSLVAGDVSQIVAGDAEYDLTRISEATQARNRLFNWYRYSTWMETGQVQVAGKDRYRPGDPVLLPWVTPAQGGHVGMRYYCTGVIWAWQHGGHYTSTLQLSRGHNSDMLTSIRDAIDDDAAKTAKDCPHHWASVD